MLNDWLGGSAATAGDAERRGSAEWKGRGFCLKDFRGWYQGRGLPRSGWRAKWIRVSVYIRRVLVDHVFVKLLVLVVNLLLSHVATTSFSKDSWRYQCYTIRQYTMMPLRARSKNGIHN